MARGGVALAAPRRRGRRISGQAGSSLAPSASHAKQLLPRSLQMRPSTPLSLIPSPSITPQPPTKTDCPTLTDSPQLTEDLPLRTRAYSREGVAGDPRPRWLRIAFEDCRPPAPLLNGDRRQGERKTAVAAWRAEDSYRTATKTWMRSSRLLLSSAGCRRGWLSSSRRLRWSLASRGSCLSCRCR